MEINYCALGLVVSIKFICLASFYEVFYLPLLYLLVMHCNTANKRSTLVFPLVLDSEDFPCGKGRKKEIWYPVFLNLEAGN